MHTIKHSTNQYIPEETSNLRKGIDNQREIYKHSNLQNDHETMTKALENIKAEIKNRAINKKQTQKIVRITQILNWYKDLPYKYTKKTPTGLKIKYPPQLELLIQKNLNIAYELTIDILNILNLI